MTRFHFRRVKLNRPIIYKRFGKWWVVGFNACDVRLFVHACNFVNKLNTALGVMRVDTTAHYYLHGPDYFTYDFGAEHDDRA